MPPRNLTIFGVPNHSSKPYTSFSLTHIATPQYDPSYLKTDEPSDTARILSLDPKDTQWIFNLGLPSRVVGLALVNHNLYKDSQIRFISPVSTYYTPKVLIPVSVISSSNVTGNHTAVDETISSPDGSNIYPTINANPWYTQLKIQHWSVIAVPTVAPILGTDLACVVLRAKKVVVSGTDHLTPKLTVDLYEAGVFKKTLGYRSIRSTVAGGQVFIFPFDFNDLTDKDGSDLEIRVSGTAGTTLGGSLSSYGVLETLNVYYDDQTWADDSGWITIETEDSVSSNLSEPTKSNHFIPVTPWTVQQGVILIRSDQSQHDAPLDPITSQPIYNGVGDSLTYIEAGVAPIGDGLTLSASGLTPESPPSYGINVNDLSSGYTLSGQSYGAATWKRRHTPPLTIVVYRSELKILQQMYWTRGHSGAVYIALEPDLDLTWQKFSAFWATIKSLSEPVQIYHADDETAQFRVTIEFEEKL